jgi:hypothetical protein
MFVQRQKSLDKRYPQGGTVTHLVHGLETCTFLISKTDELLQGMCSARQAHTNGPCLARRHLAPPGPIFPPLPLQPRPQRSYLVHRAHGLLLRGLGLRRTRAPRRSPPYPRRASYPRPVCSSRPWRPHPRPARRVPVWAPGRPPGSAFPQRARWARRSSRTGVNLQRVLPAITLTGTPLPSPARLRRASFCRNLLLRLRWVGPGRSLQPRPPVGRNPACASRRPWMR